MGGAADFYQRGLPIVDEDPETDITLVHMAIDVYGGHTPGLARSTDEAANSLCSRADSLKKPIAAALFSGGHPDTVLAIAAAREKLTKTGVPVYSGVESASRAINKLMNYYEFVRKAP